MPPALQEPIRLPPPSLPLLRTWFGGNRERWLHLRSSASKPAAPLQVWTPRGWGARGTKVRLLWALGLTPVGNIPQAENIPGPAASPGGLLGQGLGAPSWPPGVGAQGFRSPGQGQRKPFLLLTSSGLSSQQGLGGVPGAPLCHCLPSLHRWALPLR